MSALSECAYCAGWIEGLEFDLWCMLSKGIFKFRQFEITPEDVRQLRILSDQCGGWIYFHEQKGESFIPFEEWGHMALEAERRG